MTSYAKANALMQEIKKTLECTHSINLPLFEKFKNDVETVIIPSNIIDIITYTLFSKFK